MRPKRAIRLVRKQLKRDPRSLALKIRLASLLCEVGKSDEGVKIFREVAEEYRLGGRLSQAIAVCRSALELDPSRADMQALLADLEVKRLQEDARNLAAPPVAPPPESAPAPQRSRLARRSRPIPGVFEPSRPPPSAPPPSPEPVPRVEPADLAVDDYDEDAPTRVATDHHYEALGGPPRSPVPADVLVPRDPAPSERARSLPLRASAHGEIGESEVGIPLRAATTEQDDYAPADATIVDDSFSVAHLLDDPAVASPTIPIDMSRLQVLSSLPEAVLESLARGIFVRRIESGDIVLREGDLGDSCFVIASGAVRVLKRDPMDANADLIDVARLAEGELFGEFALLGDRRRHATVQALRTTELYEIPRRLVMDLSARHPGVVPTLQRLYRRRLLETLMKTAPFFSALPPEKRSELMERFTPVRAASGECVIREGERAGGFYLIVSGTIEVSRRLSDHKRLHIATLSEGTYVGEISLLRGDVAQATVTALGPTELAMLPAKSFYALVASNPVLWAQVRDEADRRLEETHRILAGVTSTV